MAGRENNSKSASQSGHIAKLLLLVGSLLSGAAGLSVTQGAETNPSRSKTAGQYAMDVADTADAHWIDILSAIGKTYKPPTAVMFSGTVRSVCGFVPGAMGPFYCPSDQKVYLDATFFGGLQNQFGACETGSMVCRLSVAYIIAHEFAHHVQNSLGLMTQRGAQEHEPDNSKSSRELQADCLAGVWAKLALPQRDVTPIEVETAMRAAATANDSLQKRSLQGYAVPDPFTLGSLEQRVNWFMTGFKSGTLSGCDM